MQEESAKKWVCMDHGQRVYLEVYGESTKDFKLGTDAITFTFRFTVSEERSLNLQCLKL